eukprot:Gb_39234 [translate_table: standard]
MTRQRNGNEVMNRVGYLLGLEMCIDYIMTQVYVRRVRFYGSTRGEYRFPRSTMWGGLVVKICKGVVIDYTMTQVPLMKGWACNNNALSSFEMPNYPLPLARPTVYVLKDHKYENWGLHVWGDVHVHTSWETPLFGTGFDDHGIYWDIQVKLDGVLHFIVHKGDTKDCSGSVSVSHANIWVVSERSTLFMEKPDLASLRKRLLTGLLLVSAINHHGNTTHRLMNKVASTNTQELTGDTGSHLVILHIGFHPMESLRLPLPMYDSTHGAGS